MTRRTPPHTPATPLFPLVLAAQRVDPKLHPAVASALASDLFRFDLARRFRDHLRASADLVDEPELRDAELGRRLVSVVLGEGGAPELAPPIELRIDWQGRTFAVGAELDEGPLAGLYGVCASYVEDGIDEPTVAEWLARLDRIVRRCASEGRQDTALKACAAFLCLQADAFPRGALPMLVLGLLRALREEGGSAAVAPAAPAVSASRPATPPDRSSSGA